MLLALPPEILEMVLLVVPPDSFASLMWTCRSIRVAARASPKIMRAQLLKVPGTRCTDDSDYDRLADHFFRNNAREGNGLQIYSDVIVHRPLMLRLGAAELKRDNFYRERLLQEDLWTRPRINLIQPCCPKGCENGLMAAAADYRGVIHCYKIRKGRISPIFICDPRTLEIEDFDPAGNEYCLQYTCLAMAWQRCENKHLDHVVALFSYDAVEDSRDDFRPVSATTMKIPTPIPKKTLKLCLWKLCKGNSKPIYTLDVQINPEDQVAALAVTEADYCRDYNVWPVAVIYRHQSGCPEFDIPQELEDNDSRIPPPPGYRFRIMIYHMGNNTAQIPVHAPTPPVGTLKHNDLLVYARPIKHARFTKGPSPELWLYGDDTAPMGIISGCVRAGIRYLNPQTAQPEPSLFSKTSRIATFRGIPLSTMHRHEVGEYSNGNKYCIQTVLELVAPRIRPDGIFLIKYVEQQDTCSTMDITQELDPLEFVVVAKLMETNDPKPSTLRRIITVSADGNRVAIADWKTIKIYDIHPDAFLDQRVGSLPNALMQEGKMTGTYSGKQNKALQNEFPAADDEAYTTNCGQGYFHDYIRIKGKENRRIVAIWPKELPSRGVVYAMAFSRPDRLYAWTDQGLVQWYWGRRRKHVLESWDFHPVSKDLWCY